MIKVIFVAHCILNTAAKVVQFDVAAIDAEEKLRVRFINEAIRAGIQLVQLPCPEFTLYGSKRWGHVSNQFDNPFFIHHCRETLTPIVDQIEEYLKNPERFEVLGIVGIDGSPSCGVDYTCEGNWYGSFGARENLKSTITDCKLVNRNGVFIRELKRILSERNLLDQISFYTINAEEPEKCLKVLTNNIS